VGLQAQALLDAAVDAVIVIDASGCIEQVSRSATQMFRATAVQMIGHNVAMLMPEPYRREHDNYMHRYMSGGKARIIGIGREVQARRLDGTVFPCNLSVGEVAGSVPRRFVGILHDLSEYRAAVDRLRRSESDLRLAQQLANVGNYVNYVDGDQPDYYSPQLRRILCLPEDWVSLPLHHYVGEWVHPDDRPMVTEQIRRLVEDDAPFDVEYRAIVGDGSERHLHHISQCTRNERGRITRLVGTIHDGPSGDAAAPPALDIAGWCDHVGGALAVEPWVDRVAGTVLAAPTLAGGRWVLSDETGSLTLAADTPGVATVVAASAGGPIPVTVEWTVDGVVPLSVHLPDRVLDVGPRADPSFVSAA
jgi:PAS domain S-box-containing protein